MTLTWPTKDPDDVLDYGIEWKNRLKGDTITASEWIVPEDLVVTDDYISGTLTTAWISGGVNKRSYKVTNRITTAAGRTIDQGVTLRVSET